MLLPSEDALHLSEDRDCGSVFQTEMCKLKEMK
jgi:hypothetical protein